MKTLINKTVCVLAVAGILFSSNVLAKALNEDNDNKLINELITLCYQDAKEDNVSKTDLLDYLVTCINDELELDEKQPRSHKSLIALIKQSKLVDVTQPE